MVDAQLIDERSLAVPPSIDHRTLLAELVKHPFVVLLRFADEGPPPETVPDPGVTGARLYEGWAVIHEHDEPSRTWEVIFRTSDENYTLSVVMGNATDVAAADTTTSAYEGMSDQEAADRRRADALAANVADQALDADLFVTEREYLNQAKWSITRRTTICSVEEALTLLGLYLRAQGEFMVANRLRYNRGLFFWVGMREILPAAWRWFAACGQYSDASNDESLLLLGGSLLQRIDRALEARDAIHVALNQPQNNDVREDALSNLDVVLLLLMGALDIAARVAHRVLMLPAADEFTAGWQKTKKGGWLDQVRSIAPNLAAVVDPGTKGQHALTIVRCLRNSVHGAALQGIHVVIEVGPAEMLVGLPPDDEAALLSAMDALGGRASWGVRVLLHGRTHVDPGLVADQLFETVVPLLNELMEQTPVETMAGVNLRPEQLAPSADENSPFREWARRSIRWQLGL